MNKQHKKLLLITALVMIIAVVSLLSAPKYSEHFGKRGQRVFPDLLENLNDIVKLQIDYPNSTKIFEKQNDVWSMPAHGNYPAASAYIREVIISMARLEYFDTGKDIAIKDKCTVITLFGKNNNVIAKLTLDKEKQIGRFIDGISAKAENDVAFSLIKGKLDVHHSKLHYWLKQPLLQIAPDRIKSVIQGNSKGGRSTINRLGRGKFEFLNMPKGYKVADVNAINKMVNSLKELKIINVRKIKPEDNINNDNSPYAVFETLDSLVVKIFAHNIEGEIWVALKVFAREEASSGDVLKEALKITEQTEGYLFEISVIDLYNIMTPIMIMPVNK